MIANTAGTTMLKDALIASRRSLAARCLELDDEAKGITSLPPPRAPTPEEMAGKVRPEPPKPLAADPRSLP